MSISLSTLHLQKVLTYPFEDENWKSKILIGIGISFASMVIPFLPGLISMGYAYQIMHRLIVDKGELYLPIWDDWGKLLLDGWRLFSVSLVYNLPAIVISIFGWLVYIGAFIGMAATEGSNPDSTMPIIMLLGMGVFFLSIGLTIFLIIGISVILPAALGHTVAKGSFTAGFDFSGWWKVLKANLGGFFLALFIIFGMITVMYLLIQLLYMTIVLICLMFILPLIVGHYIMLVSVALIGLAYREGIEKLEQDVKIET